MLKLDRYLLGDFVQSFLATLIVLLVVSVGGVLVDTLNWRWVFGINLVPLAVTLLLALRLNARLGLFDDGLCAALSVGRSASWMQNRWQNGPCRAM